LLIGTADLDDVPERPRLQLHLHQERPIRVIGLGENEVAAPTAHLTNHPLDYDVVVGGAVGGLLLVTHLAWLENGYGITCQELA
jgi:hypothetical protein